MTEWTPDNQNVPWNKTDPEENRRRTAWSIANSCAIETGEKPIDLYNKMLERFRKMNVYEP
jgi:hypothetical protein